MQLDYQPPHLRVTDLLAEAIQIYRAHAVTFLMIVAVVLVPTTLAEYFIQQRFVAPALDTLVTQVDGEKRPGDEPESLDAPVNGERSNAGMRCCHVARVLVRGCLEPVARVQTRLLRGA